MNHFESPLHPVLASACNCGHSSIKKQERSEQEKRKRQTEEEKHKIEREMDYDNLPTLTQIR